MAIQVAAVANSIAAVAVSGLTIFDIDELPMMIDTRQTPVFAPNGDWITEFNMVRDSFGGGSTAKMTVSYTLNYRLYYAMAGTGRTSAVEPYNGMTDMIAAILDAILAIDTFTGGIDIVPVAVFNIGLVSDPSENAFHGCDMAFRVTEFVN